MLLRSSCLMLAAVAVSMLAQVADFAPVTSDIISDNNNNNSNTLEQRWVDLGMDITVPTPGSASIVSRDLEARGDKKKKKTTSSHKKKKTSSKKKPQSKKKKTSSKKKKTSSKKKSSSKKKTNKKKKPSSGGGSYKGDGTYYNPSAGTGSCGHLNTDHDMVAALNAPQMGVVPNPNNNPNCGRYASVKGPKGTVRVKIVDTCPPCLKGSLDLSPAAFMKIADLAAGRVAISWSWD